MFDKSGQISRSSLSSSAKNDRGFLSVLHCFWLWLRLDSIFLVSSCDIAYTPRDVQHACAVSAPFDSSASSWKKRCRTLLSGVFDLSRLHCSYLETVGRAQIRYWRYLFHLLRQTQQTKASEISLECGRRSPIVARFESLGMRVLLEGCFLFLKPRHIGRGHTKNNI